MQWSEGEPMTLGKPDPMPVVQWLLGDIRPKHLLMAASLFCGAYYATNARVSAVSQMQAEQQRQIEQLNSAMALKLDKTVYETQQQATNLQLKGISDTVDRIEQFLMDHPRSSK